MGCWRDKKFIPYEKRISIDFYFKKWDDILEKKWDWGEMRFEISYSFLKKNVHPHLYI